MRTERLWKGSLRYKLTWDVLFFGSILFACIGLFYWIQADTLYYEALHRSAEDSFRSLYQEYGSVSLWSWRFWGLLWGGAPNEGVRNILLESNRSNLFLLFFLFFVVGMFAYFLRLYQAGYVTLCGYWVQDGERQHFEVLRVAESESSVQILEEGSVVRQVFFRLASWDGIPNDCFLLICCLILGIFTLFIFSAGVLGLVILVGYFWLAGIVALVLGTALVRRIRRGDFWKHCLLYFLGCALIRALRLFWEGVRMRRRVAVGLVLFLLPLYQLARGLGLQWLWWICGVFLLVLLLRDFFLIAHALDDFSDEEIRAQQLEVALKRLVFPYSRSVLRRLYSMQDRIEAAVLEQTRADRQRNELITNVTHDLRTPLTSILNAVDLLRSGALSEEEQREQLEILAERAQRLQGLQTDLLEVSKAATGDIPLQLARLDLHLFLLQVAGDWQSEWERAKLQLIFRVRDLSGEERTYYFGQNAWSQMESEQADELQQRHFPSDEGGSQGTIQVPLSSFGIECDPDYLQRVFENLFANACKYSLSDSRVYLSLDMREKVHEIRLRNYAREPLTRSAEELMERFVREEKARSGTGSGLGLAIARSLIELMHGRFEIHIQEDLFEVRIEFVQTALAPEQWDQKENI